MKKPLLYTAIVSVILSAGCTKNFDSINTDPTQASASTFDPNLLLPTVELSYVSAVSGYAGPLLFQSMWAQTFANAEYPTYYSNGDKYVASTNRDTYDASTWNNGYTAASQAREMQNLSKGNDALTNLSCIGDILEIASIQVITDTYGDCPYAQALEAKSSATYRPVYDKQQDIYNTMLTRLDSVLPLLDASKAKPTNDASSYGGDVAKWKKFGYSLMLKIAMRLTKADAATAQKYAEKAAAGGTMSGIGDNLYVIYDNTDGYTNPNSGALVVAEDYAQVKWGKILIDTLKATNDPRLSIIAEVPDTGLINQSKESLAGNSADSAQQGMPNGYDQNGGATDISKAPDYPGGTGTTKPGYTNYNPVGKYSRPKTSLYLGLNAPFFILTYAESELLLAEAAARGWNAGGTATVHYANGVAGALQTYGTYGSAGAIDATTATAYAAAHPLMAASLEQINMQYWITTGTLFNFSEAWSNWRRSGYPVLTPVNYTGNFTNGQIPRRQVYPLSEATTNGTNFSAGVSSNGGNDWTTHVYWDK